jgi:hypothetical protein
MLNEMDQHADKQARIPATMPTGESLPLPAREAAVAAEYARAEKAAATRRAYRTDFELFRAWCAERRVSVLPASPESVAAFLAHEAERPWTSRTSMRPRTDCASARRTLGLDPAGFAGHSLRSGFLTSAAARGASVFKMADQSRHKSMDTLRGYVRDAKIFKDHAGSGLL